MNDQQLVKECLAEIFRMNGYTDSKSMTQRDFEHIGNEIEKKSGILISSTTIKRLSNGNFSRLPQIATLNAISNYHNFNSWQEYKLAKEKNGKSQNSIESITAKKNHIIPVFRYLLFGIIFLSILFLIFFIKRQPDTLGATDKATFSFHKNTTNEIPNTVVFNYNVDEVNADSFFIQQSWDKNRRVKVNKGNYTLTDIYYEPGYHIAKLYANDSIIKEVEVSIPTDKWFFYAAENKPMYVPEYIKSENYFNKGILRLEEEDILKNKIDITKEKAYIYCYFPTKMNISSENFRLKTRVRMKELRSNFCPYLEVEIYCQRNYILLRSTTPGCAGEALMQFGEKVYPGREHDLASITYDVTKWTDIEFIVNNKVASILINGKEQFKTTYKNATKLITGLAFISNGLCEVEKVEFTDVSGKRVLNDMFFQSNDFSK